MDDGEGTVPIPEQRFFHRIPFFDSSRESQVRQLAAINERAGGDLSQACGESDAFKRRAVDKKAIKISERFGKLDRLKRGAVFKYSSIQNLASIGQNDALKTCAALKSLISDIGYTLRNVNAFKI